MSRKGHLTMADALACTEQHGKAWIARTHTQEEMRAAGDFMLRGFPPKVVDSWSLGMCEALVGWKLIVVDLEAAHRHIWAGGGVEAQDHVRSLLLIEQRIARIAEAHHKHVDQHGGPWGECN